MNYHQKNKDEILKTAYGGGKEKAKKYYRENNKEIKKRERKRYRNLDKFEKKIR